MKELIIKFLEHLKLKGYQQNQIESAFGIPDGDLLNNISASTYALLKACVHVPRLIDLAESDYEKKVEFFSGRETELYKYPKDLDPVVISHDVDNIMDFSRMSICPRCHNKRCPKATDTKYACTGLNTPDQELLEGDDVDLYKYNIGKGDASLMLVKVDHITRNKTYMGFYKDHNGRMLYIADDDLYLV